MGFGAALFWDRSTWVLSMNWFSGHLWTKTVVSSGQECWTCQGFLTKVSFEPNEWVWAIAANLCQSCHWHPIQNVAAYGDKQTVCAKTGGSTACNPSAPWNHVPISHYLHIASSYCLESISHFPCVSCLWHHNTCDHQTVATAEISRALQWAAHFSLLHIIAVWSWRDRHWSTRRSRKPSARGTQTSDVLRVMHKRSHNTRII